MNSNRYLQLNYRRKKLTQRNIRTSNHGSQKQSLKRIKSRRHNYGKTNQLKMVNRLNG